MASCIRKLLKSLRAVSTPQDAITAEWSVYTNVVNDLRPLYLGNSSNTETSVLHVALFEGNLVTAFSATIASGEFVAKLQSEIHKELGIHFADIKVYTID